MNTFDWKVLAAGIVGFSAGVLVASSRHQRKHAELVYEIDSRIEQLTEEWGAMQDALHRASSRGLNQSISSMSDVRPPLYVGARAKIATCDDVMNSSLWDSTNTDHCGELGVVRAIDADGDIEFAMDKGPVITVDIKFVMTVNEHKTLPQQTDMVGRLVKHLEIGREQRARHGSSFSVTTLS